MNLKKISANETELTVNGIVVLFSYNTPVACFVSTLVGSIPAGYYKTSKKWSKTTSKHINKWFLGVYEEKDQQFFDNLISGV